MAAQANQGTETKKRFSLFSYIRETKQELKRVSQINGYLELENEN